MSRIGFNLNGGSGALRDPDAGTTIDFTQITNLLYRRRKTIMFCAAILVMLGAAITLTTPKYYDARALVLLDQNIERTIQQVSNVNKNATNNVAMESARLVILSDDVARTVVERLDLTNEPAFMSPPIGLSTEIMGTVIGTIRSGIRTVTNLISPPTPVVTTPVAPTETDIAELRTKSAVRILQARLSVSRVGNSSAFSIYYRSSNPVLSTNIVNTFADVYVSDVLNANYAATERMTEWMQVRLTELEGNAQQAAIEAEMFRAENGLIVGSNTEHMSADAVDRLNSDLSEAITELARAGAMTSALSAAVDAGQDALKAGVPGGIPEIRDDDFRARQRTLSDALSDLRAAEQLGNTARIAANENRVSQAAERLYSTMLRLVEQARGNESLAEARVDALRESLGIAVSKDAAAGPAQVKLRSLEQRAETLSTLYQAYLTRFREIDQQRSFPVSNVRVLNYANVSRNAAGPSLKKNIVIYFVLGLILAAVIIAFKEWRDRFVRTSDHVTRSLGVPFLGYLPLMSKRQMRTSNGDAKRSEPHPWQDGAPVSSQLFALHNLRSQYSETLRNIVLTSDLSAPLRGNTRGRVVAVTSSRPREGKSLSTLNLATVFAASGKSVCLIDADPYCSGLTKMVGVNESGLIEVLSGAVEWQSAVKPIPSANVDVLPCNKTPQFAYGPEMLASTKMHDLLDDIRLKYDIVLLDLAPMGPVIDTRALLRSFDQLIVIAEWGKTTISLIKGLLSKDPKISEKLLGVVLNKVDMKKMNDYASEADSVSYLNEYNAYID